MKKVDRISCAAPVEDDTHIVPPRRTPSSCHCEPVRRLVWQSVCPVHFASGVVLSFFGERKYPKNAAKTKVFESFAHIGVKLSVNYPLRNWTSQTKPCFRMDAASTSACCSRSPR